MKYQRPRGTQDLFGPKAAAYAKIEEYLRMVAAFYNYAPLVTPVFESAELFIRSVGEASDIATKEMYAFKDKGERAVALRPEGTAGAVRALVENKLLDENLPVKIYYFGPMFRYERPQTGRYREFYQFGVEMVGSADYCADVENIVLAFQILTQLARLREWKLIINNLGGKESRARWSEALKSHLEKHRAELSEASQRRLGENPLRILDDKIDGKKPFVLQAPRLADYLSPAENERFKQICTSLAQLGIDYRIDSTMVRGLDYYTGAVFEFVSTSSHSASQDTLIGGGRYDGLVKELGGPDLPAVGFGLGIERLLLAMAAEKIDVAPKPCLDAYVVFLGEKAKGVAINVLTNLRLNGLRVDSDFGERKLAAQFKRGARMNARYVVIIGDKELAKEAFVVKNQATEKQVEVPADKLADYLKEGK